MVGDVVADVQGLELAKLRQLLEDVLVKVLKVGLGAALLVRGQGLRGGGGRPESAAAAAASAAASAAGLRQRLWSSTVGETEGLLCAREQRSPCLQAPILK